MLATTLQELNILGVYIHTVVFKVLLYISLKMTT
jgi:hypothetical protein